MLLQPHGSQAPPPPTLRFSHNCFARKYFFSAVQKGLNRWAAPRRVCDRNRSDWVRKLETDDEQHNDSHPPPRVVIISMIYPCSTSFFSRRLWKVI